MHAVSRRSFLAASAALVAPCIIPASAFGADAPPAPKHLGDPAKLGLGVQRTMTLLATSTPEKRNTVRILFYGQSITEQDWWKIVADDLRRRFPHANLIIENRALGGFSSQRLVKTAATDLYSFYPDLMIFHVYGSHIDYESIIRRTRERTTAEILIQTDHATNDADHDEEIDPAKLMPDGKMWNAFMNYRFLPEMAAKYNTGLVDQRNLWKRYLKDHNLPAQQLLRDAVHLNAHGCFLMAELTRAYLVRRDEPAIDPMNCDTVKTLIVGKDVQWADGKLAVEFEGNRVDVILTDGQSAPASVLIDGKKPSEHLELYGFTRALAKPGGKWPVVTNLKSDKLPLLEDWTMQVKKDPADEKRFTFTLSGSKTGPDGEDNSAERFTSNSGRIILDPADWDVAYAMALAGVKPIPPEFTVRWKTIPWFVDRVTFAGAPQKSIERIVTVAQGLKNDKHTLTLAGTPNTPIAAIRIHKPPLAR